MVFDDHVDVLFGAELGQFRETVSSQFDLLVPCACAGGVDPDGMAPEELCRVDPLSMIVDCLLPFRRVGVANISFAITHNEKAFYP